MAIHSLTLFIYGHWWRYNASNAPPGFVFKANTPKRLLKHHLSFLRFSYFGDLIFMVLGISSFSALLPLFPFLRSRDPNVHTYFIIAASFMFLAWVSNIWAFSLDY